MIETSITFNIQTISHQGGEGTLVQSDINPDDKDVHPVLLLIASCCIQAVGGAMGLEHAMETVGRMVTRGQRVNIDNLLGNDG